MAPNLLKAALAVLVFGWAPILLYMMFGPADGNPIGLGLLAWTSTPVSLILAVASGFALFMQRVRESRV